MNETTKVFLACALGAFMGTMVSLEVNRYFWWLGLITGGFVGYISHEFKKVVMAVPTAWRKARGWQPYRAWWREYLQLTFAFGGLMTTFFTPAIIALMVVVDFPLLNYASMARWLVCFFGGVVMGTLTFYDWPIEKLAREGRDLRRDLRFVSNPFRFYFWLLPKWTLKGGWWLLRNSPSLINEMTVAIAIGISAAAKFTVRFGRFFFREIHSDIRMLCGLDAAIGTVIGYFAGSAVIGALAGGLWGALNFEILSIRILKLVPIEKSLFR